MSRDLPTAIARLRQANTIAYECLRHRCADDPDALELIDIIEVNFNVVADGFTEAAVTIMDAAAVAQEHSE